MGNAGTARRLSRRLRVLPWAWAGAVLAAMVVVPAAAQYPMIADHGGVGLLQTPSARFMDDGTFVAGGSLVDPYRRAFLTGQLLPFAEVTFRYTEISNRLYGPQSFSGDQSFKDRGFDVKLQLLSEGPWRPALAMGLRDVLGTGLFSSEYFVANKRLGPLDFSFGVGFGNMGSRGQITNPLSYLSDRFKTRKEEGDTSQIGNLSPNFFRGEDLSFFGGVRYELDGVLPIDGVSAVLEFDGNSYQDEPLDNRFDVDAPVNAALVYQPRRWLDTAVGFERGNTVMVRISGRLFANEPRVEPRVDTSVPAIGLRDQPSRTTSPLPEIAIELPSAVGDDAFIDGLMSLEQDLGVSITVNLIGAKAMDLQIDGVTGRLDTRLIDAIAEMTAIRLPSPPQVMRLVIAGPGRAPLAHLVAIPPRERALARRRDRQVVKAAAMQRQPTDGFNRTWTTAAFEAAFPDRLEQMREMLDGLGLDMEGAHIEGRTATVAVRNRRYSRWPTAYGRTARVMSQLMPVSIERLRVVAVEFDLPVQTVTLYRSDLEDIVRNRGSLEEVFSNTSFGPGPKSLDVFDWQRSSYPRLNYSMQPKLRETVGGPDEFVLFQAYWQVLASAELAPGLAVRSVLGADIYNTFDQLTLRSDSTLPRVRTDVGLYLQEGANSIDRLYLDYRFKPASQLYGRVVGGILEEMFVGYGGELLYAPHNQPWAISGDLYYARQRDYDKLFNLRDYDVVTGHARLNYDFPFYNASAEVAAGKYLAGDVGATLTLAREYSSGFRLGFFASQTNISAEEFGEGSFDKGFFFSVPFDQILKRDTRARSGLLYRPLTRDGAQMLDIAERSFGGVAGQRVHRTIRDWQYLDN